MEDPEASRATSLLPTTPPQPELTKAGWCSRGPSGVQKVLLLVSCVVAFQLTFVFVQWRFWKTDITSSVPGRLTGEFLILYSIVRIVDEFYREPDASLILGMSRGQYYSLFLAAAGIALCMLATKAARVGTNKIEN